MNKILLYLLESGACLLVFYLLYTWLLKRENCFWYNRFYLLLTPLLSFIIPLVGLPFLQQPDPLTIFVTEQLAPVTISVNAAPSPVNNWFNWKFGLFSLYYTGVVFFLCRLLKQLYQLHRFTQKTQANHFYWQNIRVQKTEGAQPTFSFGNRIFLDNSQTLSESETERILLHEAVHIRQKHTLDILYLEIFKIIFWFNPLLYFYQQALTSTHEFIADAAVLRITTPETYANLLARQMLHRMEFSFGNYFNKSLTLQRMKMLQQTHYRPSTAKLLAALPALGILLFVLSCAEPETPVNHTSEATSQTLKNDLDDEVFTFVEQNPVFPGGLEKMFAFLGQNIKYPKAAIKVNLEGTVTTQFTVTKEGKITDIQIEKSLSPETDAEAKRVIALMPNWNPGKQDEKPVNVRYTLPIRFALNEATVFHRDATDEIEETFVEAEQSPQFSGGLETMYRFLGNNIKYPKAAVQANLEGMVIAKFQVTKEGKIKDIRIEKSLSPETDAEARRVISLMPPWEPGKQNGRPVNVEYTLPIKFSLGAAEPKKAVQPLKTGFFWNNSRIHWKMPLQANC